MKLLAMTDAEILKVITPIMDNMMLGSTEINHAQHTRDFSERMKAVVTPENLEVMCQAYQAKWGTFAQREFVALFRRQASIAVIWRQYCTNTSDEYVAEAVFVEDGNRLLIDHAMVY